MNDPSLSITPSSRNGGAIKIAGIYLFLGGMWILFSDRLAASIAADQAALSMISTYKGWGFVLVTAILLYWLIQRHISELSRNEKQLRLIANSLPAFISYTDSDKRYRFNNKTYEEWFGQSLTDMHGKHVQDIMGGASYQAVSSQIDRVLSGQTVKYETEIMHKEKGKRIVSVEHIPDIGQHGQVKGYFTLAHDITESKLSDEALVKSEKRYRSLFENMTNGFARCQVLFENGKPQDFIYLDVNKAFTKLTHLGNVIGKRVSEVIPGIHETNPELLEIYGRVALTGEPESFETFVPQLETGIWFSISVYSPEKEFFVAVFEVITQRKRAEEMLRRGNEQLLSFIEHAPLSIAMFNHDMNYIATSRRWVVEYGRGHTDLIGRSHYEIHPDIPGYWKDAHRKGLAGETVKNDDDLWIQSDGTKNWLRWAIVPWSDSNNEIGGIIISAEDITEHKRAVESAIESEARYHRILDAMMEGCQIIDFDWRYVYVNNVVAEQGKRKPQELINHTMMEMYPGIEHTELFAGLRQCMEERTPMRMENQFVFPDDSIGWYELSIQPAQEGIFILSTDITERKRSDEKIRRLNDELELKVQERTAALSQANTLLEGLMDYMPDHIYFKDTQSRFIRNSRSQALMLGVGDPARVVGKTDFDFFPHAAQAYAEEQEIMRSGQPMVDFEEWVVWPSGQETWVSTTKVPMLNSEGDTIGIFGISRNITERKKTEQAIQQLNADLEKQASKQEAANKELEAFSYSVSHDLRAPLRAINGYTRILLEDYEANFDDEGKRVCSVITNEAQRMGELIDDLLAFSRLSRKEIHLSKVDMNALANSVMNELADEDVRARIDFQIGELTSTIGDPAMFRQVWVNLLANAIKFTSKMKRALIEVGSTPQDGETVYHIRDNGAGFNMDYGNKLFGVFQRLHSEADFEGTGVGLAIVQRVIHRHGGRVWAEGEVGMGATFYFALPQKREES